ncbi:unnamed protein product [Prorocentrum cordatum]|uniref:Mitochondrial ribosomal protein L37 n=1 Tax=Prorocentrum cordatum TaxID=2364126 RepID=A0ABN9W7R8_9DINO|nr:unnamed protein product [Polarella glacialis]
MAARWCCRELLRPCAAAGGRRPLAALAAPRGAAAGPAGLAGTAGAAGSCRPVASMSMPCLAPKKAAKGKAAPGGATAGPAASGPEGFTQLFNIYAGRPDEEIKPDDWYPKWLWELETSRPRCMGNWR